jgi:transcriptional regulator of heat shock response
VEIITQHGIDIEQLDNLLSARYTGKQAAAPQNDMMALIDQRLAPFQQYLNNQQQQQQAAQQREMQVLQEETTNFLNDPQFEFANDLAPDIADILELAANRGQKISLQDAYTRATMLHPTISGIIQRRNAGQNAANDSEAAIRARRAAASVSDNGAPSRDSGSDDGEDIRSALTASMRSLNRR